MSKLVDFGGIGGTGKVAILGGMGGGGVRFSGLFVEVHTGTSSV